MEGTSTESQLHEIIPAIVKSICRYINELIDFRITDYIGRTESYLIFFIHICSVYRTLLLSVCQNHTKNVQYMSKCPKIYKTRLKFYSHVEGQTYRFGRKWFSLKNFCSIGLICSYFNRQKDIHLSFLTTVTFITRGRESINTI